MTPLAVLAGYFSIQQYRLFEQSIENHLSSIAENKRNTVELFLQERIANVRNLFRPDGVAAKTSSEDLAGILAELKKESAAFVDLGLFDPDGLQVSYAGPHPSLLGKSYRNEHWFVGLHGSQKDHFVSDVYLGFRNKPHFIIAVRHAVKKTAWTLRAGVDPERFGAFVNNPSVVGRARTQSYIVNRKGERQTLPLPRASESLALPFNEISKVRLFEAALGKRKYLFAAAPVRINDWLLLVRAEKVEAYAPLMVSFIVFVLVAAGAVFLVVFAVLRQARSLVTRLEEADAAKEALERRLFHAARLASVGELAAGAAHEINNPLAIIYEEAAMLKDLTDPALGGSLNAKDCLERSDAIMAAALRGKAITKKLLSFARRSDSLPEIASLNRVVEQAVLSRKAHLEASGIKVTQRFDENAPPVSVCISELTQVVLNLINNAKDAMAETGGVLEVRTYTRDRWAVAEISDTGVGMTEEVVEKAFFPFFTTKPVGKGTGLGLSISYGIVKSFGGRIEISSTPGRGAAVCVLIPKHVEAAAATPVSEPERVFETDKNCKEH